MGLGGVAVLGRLSGEDGVSGRFFEGRGCVKQGWGGERVRK